MFAVVLVVLATQTGAAKAAGELDTSFDPNANGNIAEVAVQPDGKIVIGGEFTSVGGQARNRIARLNADGTVDTTFNPGANGRVSTLVLQRDGKILMGGAFTQVGGQTRNHIARLNTDGSLDSSFNPNAGDTVSSIALQPDGMILISGVFTQIAGQSRNYLARLTSTGALDAAFNPKVATGTNNGVFSIALQPDGKLLIGGRFTQVAGQSRNYVARLNADGTLAGALVGWPYNNVFTVALQSDGKLLLGGGVPFTGGTVTNFMARLNADGTLDAGFNPDVKGDIYGLATQSDGKILVGGLFDTVGGEIKRNLARLNADGTLDTAYNPDADNSVFSVAVQSDGRAIVVGAFTSISSQTRNRIARLYPDGAPEVQEPLPPPEVTSPASTPLASWPKDVQWLNSWTFRRGTKARIRMTMRLAKGQSPAAGHEIALLCEVNCGGKGEVLGKLRQRSSGGRSSQRLWQARFTLPYRGKTRFRIVVTAPGHRGRSQQASFTFRAPKKSRKGKVKGPKLLGQRVCLEPGSTTAETSCAR